MILEGIKGNTLKEGIDFIVVGCESSYNGILGRPALWKIKAFIAGHMLMMKLLTPAGIVMIWGDQGAARGCYAIDQDNGRKRAEVLVSGNPKALVTDAYEDPRVNAAAESILTERPGSIEETELVCISDEFPARTAKIGTGLPPGVREELTRFLKANNKVFTWSYADVSGISREIVTHRLGIQKGASLVRQKCRSFDSTKYKIIKGEV